MAIKVSVIIPAFNVEKYISKSLDSLMSQTMREFEVICVDDTSTDMTYEIMCDYCSKYRNITCIRNATNKGAAFCRNRGLEVAKGKYVIFLDSDDTYHPQLLGKLYLAAESETADVAICNVNYYDENGMVLRQSGWNQKLIKTNILTIHDDREHIFSGILIAPWNKLVKKEFLLKNKIQFQNLKTSNDVFYSMMVVACAEKMVLIPDVLVYYLHERQGNITQYKKQKKDYLICAFEEVIKQLQEKELWEKDIKKAGLIAIINRCYFLTVTSKEENMQYYITEWKNRIVPVMPEGDVREIGDNWLHYQYMFLSGRMPFFENIYQLYAKEIREYLAQFNPETTALWGAGRLTRKLLDTIPETKQCISYIVDNDIDKQGKTVEGIEICSFESVKEKVNRYLVLNEGFIEDITAQIGEADKVVNMNALFAGLAE